jgi:ribosomal protein S18 acetylase RimI-like enzyme
VPAPPAAPEAFARVLEFQRRTVELVADQVRQLEEGWVVRTPALPAVWALNHVRVDTEITPERALALCRDHLDDLGYHQLYVDHEASGRRVAGALRPAGWEVDVDVHCVLIREPDRVADTTAVVEPTEEEALALMQRWQAEDRTLSLTQDELRQLLESQRLSWRARQARRLGVRGSDGELVGITVLFSDGRVAQVEHVYVIPEARGHGHARALVTRAAAMGRESHELTFIVADDNDWPKRLYAKVGFEPVGRSWLLHHRMRADNVG